jgi:hypothetical protein
MEPWRGNGDSRTIVPRVVEFLPFCIFSHYFTAQLGARITYTLATKIGT